MSKPESPRSRLKFVGSIAEERDSARLLRSCYEQLKQAERAAPGGSGADVDDVADAIGTLEDKLDALCRSVEELRQIVCAQSMSTSAS